MSITKIRASIVGITGYTGVELLRILLAHPHVRIAQLAARVEQETRIGEIFPHLAHLPHIITPCPTDILIANSDVVFICLPHKAAQDIVAELHRKVKVIDLSADYRLDDVKQYEKYYGPHRHPHLLKEVVYGAPEISGHKAIADASTVSNPGCFALLMQLMLLPLRGQIAHADLFAITGSSGAGKTASDTTHHPVRSHNLKSYSINTHRHIAEIARGADITEAQLNFVPSSGPFVRGIFAQGFVTLNSRSTDPASFLPSREKPSLYIKAPFIRLQDTVEAAHVVGSNYCDLSYQLGNNGQILAQGALDNVVKGAGGNAVQNMNIMFGLDETTGLETLVPLYP